MSLVHGSNKSLNQLPMASLY